MHLGLGEISADGIVRMTDTEALLKANFNPAQPRDAHVAGPKTVPAPSARNQLPHTILFYLALRKITNPSPPQETVAPGP